MCSFLSDISTGILHYVNGTLWQFLKYGGLSIENNCNIHLSSGKELIKGTG